MHNNINNNNNNNKKLLIIITIIALVHYKNIIYTTKVKIKNVM